MHRDALGRYRVAHVHDAPPAATTVSLGTSGTSAVESVAAGVMAGTLCGTEGT